MLKKIKLINIIIPLGDGLTVCRKYNVLYILSFYKFKKINILKKLKNY